jgi:hypothetical protein
LAKAPVQHLQAIRPLDSPHKRNKHLPTSASSEFFPTTERRTQPRCTSPSPPKEKFIVASKDSFDYPLLGLAASIAAVGQLDNANPSFGQGWAGYGRRVGTAYADQAIGNMMTEAIFPSFLHEDPRYFRRGYGGVWSRTFYAATRVFVTRTDSGATRFNLSELLGNSTGTAISNAYYPDNRTVGNNLVKLGMQIGIDAVSQVLKEFWPDVKRKLIHDVNPNPAVSELRP